MLPYLINDSGGRQGTPAIARTATATTTRRSASAPALHDLVPGVLGRRDLRRPAAIVNAHRFIFDSRDEAGRDRLKILSEKTGGSAAGPPSTAPTPARAVSRSRRRSRSEARDPVRTLLTPSCSDLARRRPATSRRWRSVHASGMKSALPGRNRRERAATPSSRPPGAGSLSLQVVGEPRLREEDTAEGVTGHARAAGATRHRTMPCMKVDHAVIRVRAAGRRPTRTSRRPRCGRCSTGRAVRLGRRVRGSPVVPRHVFALGTIVAGEPNQ